MGRTIPSYRIATELERSKWKVFRESLNRKEKKLFDEMFDYSRLDSSNPDVYNIWIIQAINKISNRQN